MEYYSFIAGLPDIQQDDTKRTIKLSALKADIQDSISPEDQKDLNLFFYRFDNQNLCAALFKTSESWSKLGTVSKEDMDDFVTYAKDGKINQDEHLPPYFAEFIQAYLSDNAIYPDMSWENQLTTLYYSSAIEHPNEFIANYFEFNLNLQNVISALTARKHGLDLSSVVIGTTEVAENIKTNTSKDFGIAPMFPYLEETLRIEESTNALEREQRIDALRWKWTEDQTVFHYFSKERIFAYLIQLEMLERWLKLDPAEGKTSFTRLVDTLVDSVKINIVQ